MSVLTGEQLVHKKCALLARGVSLPFQERKRHCPKEADFGGVQLDTWHDAARSLLT